ncbi:MAG: UDP-N-acetylmuramoyl-L-alanyl-D-glutamate--2,6-diaminopimelate ligase [Oscillospiraceae bacterium]|nr:UDP-N-acetylmuramoyl-L-alanyl-D-glutamate--2,6-diaminopimelate ligase [Oscillospiraceae bacterium]
MLLSELLRDVEYTGKIEDVEIKDVTGDSRRVEPGSVFVCIKGGNIDGHEYAAAAKRSGAAWIVAERDTGIAEQIIVPNSRAAYAIMCANINGRPAEKMKLIGVTGTNGKTTITYLIKHILESAGKKVGLIGTIQNVIGDVALPAKYTTPDAAELHVIFSRMANAGCEYVVMEVSSQALDQKRVEGCHFETAVFTNLTQDHLDYHGSMENYFDAKKELFRNCEKAVVCIDDDYGKKLVEELSLPVTTVSIGDVSADYTAHNVKNASDGCKFAMVGNGVIGRVNFSMPGKFSASNAMLAACAAMNCGLTFEEATEGLNTCPGVKGRVEVIYSGDFTVIRDFAHGPDALEKVLDSIKECAEGRIITLFGCAGNRDRTKRPKMVAAVAAKSDFMILTSDHPRQAAVEAIAKDTLPAMEECGVPYHYEPDRYKAIKWALEHCEKGDVLLLAGKGHEDYQVLDFGTVYFDEKVIVEDLLDKMEK